MPSTRPRAVRPLDGRGAPASPGAGRALSRVSSLDFASPGGNNPRSPRYGRRRPTHAADFSAPPVLLAFVVTCLSIAEERAAIVDEKPSENPEGQGRTSLPLLACVLGTTHRMRLRPSRKPIARGADSAPPGARGVEREARCRTAARVTRSPPEAVSARIFSASSRIAISTQPEVPARCLYRSAARDPREVSACRTLA